MALIIALKGPSQSGKSTLALALASRIPSNYHVVHTSFSSFVRADLAKWWAQSGPQVFTDILPIDIFYRIAAHAHVFSLDTKPEILIEKLAKRPACKASRQLQQIWGQDFRRQQDPLYWIKQHMTTHLSDILDPQCIIIEESCRQPNEGAYVHALGGTVIDLAPLDPPTPDELEARQHPVEVVAGTWQGDIRVDMRDYFAGTPRQKATFLNNIITTINPEWGIHAIQQQTAQLSA